jgi:hypothetical protein
VTISASQYFAEGGSATDNCTDPVITYQDALSTTTCPLTITRTFTITDACGNETTETQLIYVDDTTTPTAKCKNIQVSLDASGSVTITPAQVDDGSSDDCSNPVTLVSVVPNTFDCDDVGANVVTLTVEDDCGNVATCEATVTVVDDTPPEITCPANISVNNEAGMCSAVVTFADPSYSDNCSGATIAQIAGLASGSSFPVGVTTNTFEVTDASGNKAQCSFTVTVIDNESPTITNCPNDFSVPVNPATCTAIVTWNEPVITDNCPGVSYTQTHSPGDAFPLGTTTVTYEATDAAGLVTTCSFDVTVTGTCNPNVELVIAKASDSYAYTTGQSRDLAVYIQNVGTDPTTGQITWRLTKPTSTTADFVFDPAATTANVFGGITVDNPDWDYVLVGSSAIVFTSKPGVVIDPGDFHVLGITITANANPIAQFTTTGLIFDGMGGDQSSANNIVVRTYVIN